MLLQNLEHQETAEHDKLELQNSQVQNYWYMFSVK